tara:strand:+ start:454 stop:1290 length:837 start_codon:yes stop_codon:yes gene_type:complete
LAIAAEEGYEVTACELMDCRFLATADSNIFMFRDHVNDDGEEWTPWPDFMHPLVRAINHDYTRLVQKILQVPTNLNLRESEQAEVVSDCIEREDIETLKAVISHPCIDANTAWQDPSSYHTYSIRSITPIPMDELPYCIDESQMTIGKFREKYHPDGIPHDCSDLDNGQEVYTYEIEAGEHPILQALRIGNRQIITLLLCHDQITNTLSEEQLESSALQFRQAYRSFRLTQDEINTLSFYERMHYNDFKYHVEKNHKRKTQPEEEDADYEPKRLRPSP